MPSSTIANWFCGGCLAERAVVAVSNSRRSLGVELQVHLPRDAVLRDAGRGTGQLVALDQRRAEQVLLGPGLVAGEQGLVGHVVRLLVAGELRERGLAGLGRLPLHRLVRRRALPVGSLTRLVRRLRRGGRQRRERLVVAARGGLRSRRGRGGGSRPGTRLGRGFCAGRRRAGRGGLGRRRRLHLLGGVHGPEPEQRRLADQPDQLVLLHVRHGDDQLPIAGGDHLGLADAQAVHPVLDDGLGQSQAVRVDRPAAGGVLRRQRDGGAALQVEAELRRPGLVHRHQGDQPGDQDAEHDQGASGMPGGRCCHVREGPKGPAVSRRSSASDRSRRPAARPRSALPARWSPRPPGRPRRWRTRCPRPRRPRPARSPA